MDFTSIDCFKDLDEVQQQRLREAATERFVHSGERLVEEGAPSESMYFVVSGRFEVRLSSQKNPIASIGAGQSIGEVGFLSGIPRTATAIAIRDSVVLRLKRDDYDMLCSTFPQMLLGVSRSLARKLAGATARFSSTPSSLPRTIAVCAAGKSVVSQQWIDQFELALKLTSSCIVLRSEDYEADTAQDANGALADRLNSLEHQYQFVIYVVSNAPTAWTTLAFRQSDLVLLVADDSLSRGGDIRPNQAETALPDSNALMPRWLILDGEENRSGPGVKRWFEGREISQYHHVNSKSAGQGDAGFDKLGRFLSGRATGLIASGGGAYTAAHMGCFRAFEEAGIHFDILGGASGGSAMLAALALGLNNRDLLDHTEAMMVKSGALKRMTVPVYSLVDHTYFDQCLRDNYGERTIEDSRVRFFATSTNLSTGEEMLHDRGPLWKAVRASSSIPGLLPPVVADNGDLLVDGGILDSVPVKRMKSIKQGPNIVLCFEPNHQSRADIGYEALPGRRELLIQTIKSRSLRPKVDMPGIGSVLTQSMLLNNNSLELAEESDLILKMTLPADLKLNDWHRHREIAKIGYDLTKAWLASIEDQSVLEPFKNNQI